MKTMYVTSLLALLTLLVSSNEAAGHVNRLKLKQDKSLEDTENKSFKHGSGGGPGPGSRSLLQWFQGGQGQMGMKRAEDSSYIRFGKRSADDSDVKLEDIEEVNNLLSGYRPRRTSQSSYIRFGKRSKQQQAFKPLSYNHACVEEAMQQARSISEFRKMIIETGCFQVHKREAAKKDGYIRFGKRGSELADLYEAVEETDDLA